MAYSSPMGGNRATGEESPSRAELQHWRDLAAEREAAMRALTRRPLVRLAVGIDRRLRPASRRVGSWRSHLRSASQRGRLALAALPGRLARQRRREALATGVAHLAAPPEGRSISVISLAGSLDAGWRAATGLAPELVVVGDEVVITEGIAADVRVAAEGRSRVAALALGADAASGDLLCFVPSSAEPLAPGWLARLAGTLGDDVVAATPTTLHPARGRWSATEHDLLVRAEGFALALDPTGAPIATARGAGDPLDVERPVEEVFAAPLHCLVVERAAYAAAGGLMATDDDDVASVDLCTRLRQRGGRIVHVPGSVVFDPRPVVSRPALHRPIDPRGAAWRQLVERQGPALVREMQSERGPGPTRWVITTSVPSERLAARWGDWHLAEGLAGALRRLGQDVVVQTHDNADSLAARARDVHLVVRGLAAVRRTPGQRHIVWVVSHPESFALSECDGADLVLVASSRFAEDLRTRTDTPVEVLLQATDELRFHPRPPVREHQHPVTVVAKTRNVRRRVVADALAAGIRPAIYGSGWDDLIEPGLVVSDHVDNDELPIVYSSAGVVLNDHWDTMRAWGFVSNRIFDVLACGTPVISDEIPEITELFGGAVPTYRTSAELGALVRDALADPEAARARAATGRAIVLANHTFDHRARQLIDLLDQHQMGDAHEVMPT